MRYRDLGISGSRTFIDMTVYDVLYKCCMVIFYMRKTDRFTMVGFFFYWNIFSYYTAAHRLILFSQRQNILFSISRKISPLIS